MRAYGNKDKLIAAMRKRGYALAFDRPYKLRFTHPRSKVWLDVDVVYSWNDRMITSFEPNEKSHRVAFSAQCVRQFSRGRHLGRLSSSDPRSGRNGIDIKLWGWRTPKRNYNSKFDLRNRLDAAPGELQPRLPSFPGASPE
ncbi:MAG TPA: hypothetical protein VD713_07940 [Sphingomonadales bacterium]|nr:hypothetical protein [Sphingomonadales bacterium]